MTDEKSKSMALREECLSILRSGIISEHFMTIDLLLGNPALQNMNLLPFEKHKNKIMLAWNETMIQCLTSDITDEGWQVIKTALLLCQNHADILQKKIEIIILQVSLVESFEQTDDEEAVPSYPEGTSRN